jgi:acyl-CoA reductase-like NAD-dependent aldehyde dehydrogenase
MIDGAASCGGGVFICAGDRCFGCFIGGKSVKATSGREGDVFNPNTGEVQAKVGLATEADVDAAVQAAAKALPGWAAPTRSAAPA